MSRLFLLLVGVTIGSLAYAQGGPSRSHAKSQKAAPAAQSAEDPNDVSNVPQNVQKWVGSTVDDLLTGTGKVLDDAAGKR